MTAHTHQRTGDEGPVDAAKLAFPFQLVLTILGLLLSLMVGYYSGQAAWKNEIAGLRSDVRDGFTMIKGDRAADSIRMDVIRRDLDEAQRDIKLLKIQRQEDHDRIIQRSR